MRLRRLFTILVCALVAALGAGVPWQAPGVALAYGANSIATPDSTGDVGQYTAVAIDAAGNPVVAYRDVTADGLRLLRCGDAACSSGNTITDADAWGNYNSIALDVNGYPVVSYSNPGGFLKVMHCGDATCSSGNWYLAPDSGIDGWTSMQLDASGNPVIAYHNSVSGDLKIVHCGDPMCLLGNVINTGDSGGTDDVGTQTSLRLDAAGNPVVAYFDVSNIRIKVLHCNDPDCAAGGDSITTPDTSGVFSAVPSLELDASGRPVISYALGTIYFSSLVLMHCNDANCAGLDESVETIESFPGAYGAHSSLRLDSSGDPVVAYGNPPGLKVAHCNDANCASGGDSNVSLDTVDAQWVSMALDSSGDPVVSYYDSTNHDLKLLHCGVPSCSVLTVNNIGDASDASPGDGVCATAGAVCTLRAAIEESNALAGKQLLAFNIGGGGVHTITPASALPAITDPAIIDGFTQPGASPNTSAFGSATNAVYKIELNGASAPGAIGLDISAGNTTVRGLVINQFDFGLWLSSGSGDDVEGNYIGTNVTGTSALGNGIGVFMTVGVNQIGGPSPSQRNVISGNASSGVRLFGVSGVTVQGNYIGTNAAGTAAVPNGSGISLAIGSSTNTIGGATSGAGNVLSGNTGAGIELFDVGTAANSVKGNRIGSNAAGTSGIANAFGVSIYSSASSNSIGGPSAAEGNLIGYNTVVGVSVAASSVGNSIRGNSTHDNGGLGIDLGTSGVTPNDSGDGDTGANNLQNFPLLTSASNVGNVTIAGSLNSTASTSFAIDFYASAVCDGSGNGEGARYLGSAGVTTDGTGNVSFSATLPASVSGGEKVTATATNPSGNTSEFSACVTAGAVAVTTISGMSGQAGDVDGGATVARIDTPTGIYELGTGIFFADTGNDKVKVVDVTGSPTTTTLVGTGTAGYNGDGPIAGKQLNAPRDVYVAGGVLYIADTNNCRIRKVELTTISTVAGNGTCGYDGEGPATSHELNHPTGVTVDAGGNIYIADRDSNRIRKVDAGGTMSTIAGNGVAGFAGDGQLGPAAQLNKPNDVAILEPTDDLVVADTMNNRLRRINLPSDVITTIAGVGAAGFAGDGGSATSALLDQPKAVQATNYRILFADTNNNAIRRVNLLNGRIDTIIGPGGITQPVALNKPEGVTIGDVVDANTKDHTVQIAAGVDPTGGQHGNFQPITSCSILPGISSLDFALPLALLGLIAGRKRLGLLSTRLVTLLRPRRGARAGA